MAWVALGSAAIGAAAQMSKPGATPGMMPGGVSGAQQDASGWVVNFGNGALVGSASGAKTGAAGFPVEWLVVGAVVYLLLRKK